MILITIHGLIMIKNINRIEAMFSPTVKGYVTSSTVVFVRNLAQAIMTISIYQSYFLMKLVGLNVL